MLQGSEPMPGYLEYRVMVAGESSWSDATDIGRARPCKVFVGWIDDLAVL